MIIKKILADLRLSKKDNSMQYVSADWRDVRRKNDKCKI